MAEGEELTRLLDKTKSAVFMGSTAAFLGSLMCSMEFVWDETCKTAATDGASVYWAPSFFLEIPEDTRKTVLLHELWHTAYLHGPRQGNRCPEVWNYACDHKINLDLEAQGYSFRGTNPLKDPKYIGWVEEDIYDDLNKPGMASPPPGWIPDLRPTKPEDLPKVINAVVKAVQQAKLAGAGNLPGGLEAIISKFLTPIVPWEQYLHRFMHELLDGGYSWRKPNRRFTDMYLPSKYQEDGALDHLAFIEDTSGSISDNDTIRFNSEVKFVKETYCPKKLTLVQFDTIIQYEKVFLEDDEFNRVEVHGRGGTNLTPVREWILEHRPTAAIVFSDLCCGPMASLGFEIPIIWVCISNRSATVPFGQIIHIK